MPQTKQIPLAAALPPAHVPLPTSADVTAAPAQVDDRVVKTLGVRLKVKPWEKAAALREALVQYPDLAASLTAETVRASGAHLIPELIGMAVRTVPAQAPAIVRAAIAVAPLMTPVITAAAVNGAPFLAASIADAACAAAPAYASRIRRAALLFPARPAQVGA